MNKFIEWFKKNIFEAKYVGQDCYAMRLFGVFIDFREWYRYDDIPDDGCYHLEDEILEYIKEVNKKNVRRKNKLPVPGYERIPWYVTIISWKSLYYKCRMPIYFSIGFILGFIVKGLI